jgi:hypothetical protein
VIPTSQQRISNKNNRRAILTLLLLLPILSSVLLLTSCTDEKPPTSPAFSTWQDQKQVADTEASKIDIEPVLIEAHVESFDDIDDAIVTRLDYVGSTGLSIRVRIEDTIPPSIIEITQATNSNRSGPAKSDVESLAKTAQLILVGPREAYLAARQEYDQPLLRTIKTSASMYLGDDPNYLLAKYHVPIVWEITFRDRDGNKTTAMLISPRTGAVVDKIIRYDGGTPTP